MATNFEAKLHGFRRTQDGVVVSYVVHPDDVSSELATAALGTRYMVAIAEIGDDEKPKATAQKEPRKLAEIPLSQQAGILCNDLDFQLWLSSTVGHPIRQGWSAADEVRERCIVESRAEFDTDKRAAERWKALRAEYESWLVTKRYEGSKR